MYQKIKKLIPNNSLLLVLLIPFVLCFIWYRDKLMMGGGESGLLFYDFSRHYELTKYAWTDLNLGGVNGMSIASLPTLWFFMKLQNLGIPAYLLQAGFFYTLFIISGISVYFLIKILFPKIGNFYVFVGVLFYWFNPISQVDVWNRFLNDFMIFWAYLPLSMLVFYKGIILKKYKYSVITSILSVIFAYSLVTPSFNIVLWIMLTFVFLFLFFYSNNKIFTIKYYLLSVVTFILFNLFWINQLYSFVNSSSYGTAVSEFFATDDNLQTLNALSLLLGNLTNNFRFLHGTFYASGLEWAEFNLNPLIILCEYILTGLVLRVIYIYRSKKNVVMLGLMIMLILFAMKGSNTPFGEVFVYFFKRSTVLQVFRNPFEKFGFLLPLYTAPLLSLGLWDIAKRFTIKKRLYSVYIPLAVVFMVWFYPFLSGNIFSSKDNTENTRRYEVEVPGYYKEADKWLSTINGNFRFITVPIGGEGIVYNWTKPFTGVELSGTFFKTPNISFNTTIPFYSPVAQMVSENQLNSGILKFSPITNSKFLLLRPDINYKSERMSDPVIAKEHLDILQGEKLLGEATKIGPLIFYKISDDYVWPKIFTTNQVIVNKNGDFTNVARIEPLFPKEKLAVVSNVGDVKEIGYKNLMLMPREVFVESVNYPLPKDLTDEDLTARLFFVKHTPDVWYYPMVRLKEKIQEVSQDDYLGWIIYKNGILGKRAVEIYKLIKNNSDSKIIDRAENDYLEELKSAREVFSSFISDSTPISNLVKDSLIYQRILLDRANSKTGNTLSELLVTWGIQTRFDLPIADEEYAIFTYKVENPGVYSVNINSAEEHTYYLDGNIIEDKELFLSEGIHELAYLTKSDTKQKVLDENYLLVSNTNLPSWTVDIPDQPSKYKLEFEYRFLKGEAFNLDFVQNIDTDKFPLNSNGIRKDKIFHGWIKYQTRISTNFGADTAELQFVAADEERCKQILVFENCKNESMDFEVEIRNLRLVNLDTLKPLLILKGADNIGTATFTEEKKINPTQYKVKVSKKDTRPELLVFSETYNSGWKAFINGENISEKKHLLVNIFANGWILDREGDYEITLEFTPQRTLEKSELLSTLSIIIACAAILINSVWIKLKKS